MNEVNWFDSSTDGLDVEEIEQLSIQRPARKLRNLRHRPSSPECPVYLVNYLTH